MFNIMKRMTLQAGWLSPVANLCFVQAAPACVPCDRIRMLAEGFRAMGSHVEEFEDGFTLASRPLSGGVVDAAGDHRLAMAFALAATRAAAPTTIRGASSASVSYPEFFDELGRLVA